LSNGTVALPAECINAVAGKATLATPTTRINIYSDAQLAVML
jgi:hypothetical protein